jgi:hypothetical protein
MTFFLLIVTVLSVNGQKTVSFEKFDTHYECFQALKAVADEVPNISGTCAEVKRGDQ